MIILRNKAIVFVALLSVAFSPLLVSAAAGVPTILSYQGRLANSSDDLLGGSGTTYYFKFSIWDNPTVGAGTRLWPTGTVATTSLTVRHGVFNVNIGDTANGYPTALDYNFGDNSDVYLQIEVSSDNNSSETISPRQRISAAAFAEVSSSVRGTRQSSVGTTTPISNTVLTVESTSTQSIPMAIRGFASQLADLFRVQNAAGTNLFVINNSGKVGVGTSTATRRFNILDGDSTPQFRLSQTDSVYGEFYVDSAGDVQLSSTGGNIRLQDENLWVCSGGSCGVTTPVSKGNVIVETAVIFNNKFKLEQIDASTTVMYDSIGEEVLLFDEATE